MVLYFDTETTGLRPGQICQLSYVMQDGDSLSSRNIFFTVDNMEYGAYMVHGFSKEKLQVLSGGKRFENFIDVIEQDFLSADAVVSHNTAFDFMFMRAEFERLGKIFKVKNEFCSMKKATPFCKLKRSRGDGYKYPKLNELCGCLGISNSNILSASEKIFGNKTGFHDARFDTTAVLLAINAGVEYDEFKDIRRFL